MTNARTRTADELTRKLRTIATAARDYLNAQQAYRHGPALLGYLPTEDYRAAMDERRNALATAEEWLTVQLAYAGYSIDRLPERCPFSITRGPDNVASVPYDVRCTYRDSHPGLQRRQRCHPYGQPGRSRSRGPHGP